MKCSWSEEEDDYTESLVIPVPYKPSFVQSIEDNLHIHWRKLEASFKTERDWTADFSESFVAYMFLKKKIAFSVQSIN